MIRKCLEDVCVFRGKTCWSEDVGARWDVGFGGLELRRRSCDWNEVSGSVRVHELSTNMSCEDNALKRLRVS